MSSGGAEELTMVSSHATTGHAKAHRRHSNNSPELNDRLYQDGYETFVVAAVTGRLFYLT